MAVTVETEVDSNGVNISRRFEDGVLVRASHSQMSPAGKRTTVEFDENGVKIQEIHSYATDIILFIAFSGNERSETYIHKNRLISRKTYEKVRMAFPEMPPADSSLEDQNAELLKLVGKQKKMKRSEEVKHQPDPERGKTLDDFCLKLLNGPDVADAYQWISQGHNTLGELDRTESKKLISRLKRYQCPRVAACEIEQFRPGEENTGHLVVELPKHAPERKRAIAFLGSIAQEQGFDPDPDDGQNYVYAKLD